MDWYQEPWREQANCKGVPSVFLYTERLGGHITPDIARRDGIAKKMCAECPVKTECREAGHGLPGVWGGEREDERMPPEQDHNRRSTKHWPLPPEILHGMKEWTEDLEQRRYTAAYLAGLAPEEPDEVLDRELVATDVGNETQPTRQHVHL